MRAKRRTRALRSAKVVSCQAFAAVRARSKISGISSAFTCGSSPITDWVRAAYFATIVSFPLLPVAQTATGSGTNLFSERRPCSSNLANLLLLILEVSLIVILCSQFVFISRFCEKLPEEFHSRRIISSSYTGYAVNSSLPKRNLLLNLR